MAPGNLRGVWTALVTPFDQNNQLDLNSFKKILQDQRNAGIYGVIVCGTTGESPVLSIDEKKILIELALKELKSSTVGVFAGTGSNNTEETIQLSKWASAKGVQGVLLVTPYYNKPSPLGLEAHFRAVADAVDCEVMLYNVPGRTGVCLNAETICTLSSHPKITSLKEASGSISFISEIRDQLDLKKQKLQIFSGDDISFLPSLAVGSVGIVSVASNLFPRGMIKLYQATQQNNWKDALEIHQNFYPLFRDLFIETNPVPIKAAMAYAGWCGSQVRLPLVPLTKFNSEKLIQSLKRCGVQPGMPA